MLYFPGPEREVRQMKMHRKHFVQRLAQNKGSEEAHPLVLCIVCHTLSTREPFPLTLLHFSREHALPAPSPCFPGLPLCRCHWKGATNTSHQGVSGVEWNVGGPLGHLTSNSAQALILRTDP